MTDVEERQGHGIFDTFSDASTSGVLHGIILWFLARMTDVTSSYHLHNRGSHLVLV